MQNGFIASTAGHPILAKALSLLPGRSGTLNPRPSMPWITSGPFLLSAATAALLKGDRDSEKKAGRKKKSQLATIIPHDYLFANFWHLPPPSSFSELYATVNRCVSFSKALTYQVGLSTNKRKSDFSPQGP